MDKVAGIRALPVSCNGSLPPVKPACLPASRRSLPWGPGVGETTACRSTVGLGDQSQDFRFTCQWEECRFLGSVMGCWWRWWGRCFKSQAQWWGGVGGKDPGTPTQRAASSLCYFSTRTRARAGCLHLENPGGRVWSGLPGVGLLGCPSQRDRVLFRSRLPAVEQSAGCAAPAPCPPSHASYHVQQ